MKRLLLLFWDLFRISLFVVGGGYAILAVADEVCSRRGWTREGELVDRLPVMQMVPGLVATHTAVYVGDRVAGALGSLVGVAAVALPSVAVFTLVSAYYASLPLGNPVLASACVGLRAALIGIVAATVVRSWRRSLPDAFSYALSALSLAALLWLRLPVWTVVVAAAAAGLAAELPRPRGHVFAATWLPLLLFAKYGALCFGGGFVLVPMYVEDFVGPAAPYLQIASEEFANLMALTQMTPGPIGVNGATYFGYRLCGVAGAAAASAMLLLPGSLLAFAVYRSLDRFRDSRVVRGLMRGIRPASTALMLSALWSFAGMGLFDLSPVPRATWCTVAPCNLNLVAAALAAGALWLSLRRRPGPVAVIAASAAVSSLLGA